MKRPQYVFRPNLNDPQHRRAWELLQQMPSARRKEFLVQSILAAEQTEKHPQGGARGIAGSHFDGGNSSHPSNRYNSAFRNQLFSFTLR